VFVLLHGYTPSLDASNREEATGLVTVMGLSQSLFGYPNAEAFWYDGRGDVGRGFYELEGSRGHSNPLEYNRRTYGSGHPTWQTDGRFAASRHFCVGSKDVSAKFLVEALRVESVSDRPYGHVREEALRRMDNWWYWWQPDGRPRNPGATRVHAYPPSVT
jgi:hypothetical protein